MRRRVRGTAEFRAPFFGAKVELDPVLVRSRLRSLTVATREVRRRTADMASAVLNARFELDELETSKLRVSAGLSVLARPNDCPRSRWTERVVEQEADDDVVGVDRVGGYAELRVVEIGAGPCVASAHDRV